MNFFIFLYIFCIYASSGCGEKIKFESSPEVKRILNHFDLFKLDQLKEKAFINQLKKSLYQSNINGLVESLSLNLSSSCVSSLENLLRPVIPFMKANNTKGISKWFVQSDLFYCKYIIIILISSICYPVENTFYKNKLCIFRIYYISGYRNYQKLYV